MHVIAFLLYLAALICFLIAAFRPGFTRVSLVALGLAFVVVPLLLGSAGVTL